MRLQNRENAYSNSGTTFEGTTDVGEDGMDKWFNVQTSVSISNLNMITIFLNPVGTEIISIGNRYMEYSLRLLT